MVSRGVAIYWVAQAKKRIKARRALMLEASRQQADQERDDQRLADRSRSQRPSTTAQPSSGSGARRSQDAEQFSSDEDLEEG